MRQFSCNAKPIFYLAQFFASHSHYERMHSIAASPLPTALYTIEREGYRKITSIVYDLY